MKHSHTLLALLLFVPATPVAAADFKLNDGERVVLVGNTLIEREQRYGYWETLLTSRFPERKIVFRNLGWSGDNVFGEARAGFGSVADGFRQLAEHVQELKPTVIVVGYGTNEAFEGSAGIARFEQGLGVLLDTLALTKARIVLLSPLRQEDLGRPLPDPAEQNKNLGLYRDVLRKTAERRGYAFVDFYESLDGKAAQPLTENGLHLSAYGYWRSAAELGRGLGLPAVPWRVQLDAPAVTATGEGTKVSHVRSSVMSFQLTDAVLPLPLATADAPKGAALPDSGRTLQAKGLAPGKYTLCIDGKEITTATATEWAEGLALRQGPEFDQAERLRAAIVAKNREYFHRWRPENETYLFGFRKHEQGQNAKEVAEFEKLVADLEEEIARLRVPTAHQYVLKKSSE